MTLNIFIFKLILKSSMSISIRWWVIMGYYQVIALTVKSLVFIMLHIYLCNQIIYY